MAKNHWSKSAFPSISKVFERNSYVKLIQRKILSPFPYSIGFSTQTTLSGVVQNQILDKKGFRETVLMELSKAFDTLNQELLLARLMLMVFIKIHWK